MPALVIFLLIATLLPFVGFLVLLFVGKRLGAPLAGWVGMSCVVASFACTLVAMVKWYEGQHGHDAWGMGDHPIVRTIGWLPAGGGIDQANPGFLSIGIYVDSLTIAMFGAVTLVAAIAHIFSIGFMRHEEHFARFFAFLALASFSMLGLILGSTLLHLIIFWELTGLSVYFLSGFWFEKRVASRGAMRTFIIQRIGDCGLLIGVGILFCKLGNLSLPFLWTTLGNAASGLPVLLPNGVSLSTTLMTLTGLCLFCAAVARSAQFPLHVWLTDAMEGPVPASAMACTVTALAAGVYFVARIFPILTPDARLFIAIIGVVTLTMSALIALVQNDLPRVLAWLAGSQFGYMMLAMGVGSWVGGLFHLMTHAFVMALLFLAAGSVIGAARGEQRLSELGGLWRKLPVTAGAFAVAVLAIAGTPLLSIHSSQSVIVTDAAAFALYATHVGGRAWGYWLFFALPTFTSIVTALAATRCWMLTFAGKPRQPELYDRTREHASLWGPLLGLVVPSVIAGYAMNVPELIRASITENKRLCNDWLARAPAGKGDKLLGFDQIWPGERVPSSEPDVTESVEPTPPPSPTADAHERGHILARTWASWEWIVGIALGARIYWSGYRITERFARRAPIRWIHLWLYHGMFFDELYDWTVVNLTIGLAATAGAIDRYVVCGLYNGVVSVVRRVLRPLMVKK